MNARRGLLPIVFTVALLTPVGAGCAEEQPSAAAAVPELATTLEEIDDALVAGRLVRARRLLDELIETANEARDSGELGSDEADRVLAAAARLLAQLPEPQVRASATEPEDDESGGADGNQSDAEDDTGDDQQGDRTRRSGDDGGNGGHDKGKGKSKGKGNGGGKGHRR